AVSDKPPYSTIITHGFILDEKGRKNAKLANASYGADILRLLVASSEYTTDVNIGKMRKYRNTARFMLGTLNDFNYIK
ncbi:8330_t:CDS:2, partial [Ambispora gerdemannii]